MSHTLAQPARFEIEVRHSRFLAQALPLEAAEDATLRLASLSDRAATHNCWALRYGQQYRSSDDGEPSGTAGRPILAAIDGQGFDRVLVVVTRWYGGIKLGAGGLVRAYGGCAAECLRNASRRPLLDLVEVELHCAFAHAGRVHALLAAHEAHKLGERFAADGLTLQLRLPRERVAALQAALRDATRGQGRMQLPD